jgi:hypothetical protein
MQFKVASIVIAASGRRPGSGIGNQIELTLANPQFPTCPCRLGYPFLLSAIKVWLYDPHLDPTHQIGVPQT